MSRGVGGEGRSCTYGVQVPRSSLGADFEGSILGSRVRSL